MSHPLGALEAADAAAREVLRDAGLEVLGSVRLLMILDDRGGRSLVTTGPMAVAPEHRAELAANLRAQADLLEAKPRSVRGVPPS